MKKSGKDQTKIDLGEDLLETRTIPRVAATEAARAKLDVEADPERTRVAPRDVAFEAIDELLLNAKILIGEGLLEDAKRTLRTVLKREPGNLTARDRLDDIQRIEIKRLLGTDEPTRLSMRRGRAPTSEDDPDQILTELEKEVGCGVEVESEFFKSPADREIFLQGLDFLCTGATAQDRIDLGIGFLEMELYEVAIRQFETATRDNPLEQKARGLLAVALLEGGRPFDAMIELETLIARQDPAPGDKIDYGYLAGKAQEALGHPDTAARWYRAVLQIDPQYRDAADRLKVCLKKCGSTRSSSSSPSSRS